MFLSLNIIDEVFIMELTWDDRLDLKKLIDELDSMTEEEKKAYVEKYEKQTTLPY